MKMYQSGDTVTNGLVCFLTILFISMGLLTGSDSCHAQTNDAPNKVRAETEDEEYKDDGGDPYSIKWLSLDRKTADTVLYVDVVNAVLIDSASGRGDCETNTGFDYCAYKLTANVKEVFKGVITSRNLELVATAESFYKKENFLGEQVVFLTEGTDEKTGTRTYGMLENTSRSIEYDVLEKLRGIIDPKSAVDDQDEKQPYSIKALKKNFEESDAVMLADLTTLKEIEDEAGGGVRPFMVGAAIREVFKGDLKRGRSLSYWDDLLYRPMRQSDLGLQVIFLMKDSSIKGTVYKRLEYTEGDIKHGIVEKLRRIARETRARTGK